MGKRQRLQTVAACLCVLCSIVSATTALAKQSSLPDIVDNSATKYFPQIGNQGKVAACDWFAVVYYQMTFAYNRQHNQAATPATTFSPQFGYPLLSNANSYPENIRLTDVYHFIEKHGSATIADLPYTMADGSGYKPWTVDASIWEKALNYRTLGFSYFTYMGTASGADYSFDSYTKYFYEIKKLLHDGELLVIQTKPDVNQPGLLKKLSNDPRTDQDDNYVGESIIANGINGYHHTMAIVGYNDHLWVDLNEDGKVQDNEKGAIKLADSFGSNAAKQNHGFLWMAYSTVKNSIFQHRVNRLKIRNNYKPKILAFLTLNTKERDKIKFQFGITSSKWRDNKNNPSTQIFDPVALGYGTGEAGVSLIKGGNFAFDGGEKAIDGSFVFDLTDIKRANDSKYWYLRIDNREQKISVKDFKIVNRITDKTHTYKKLPKSIGEREAFLYIEID